MKAMMATLAALSLAVPTAANAKDARVEAALNKQKIKYEVDKDGDYRVVYDEKGDRTQLVLIYSNTESFGDLKVREIVSVAADSKTPLPREVISALLNENATVKFGAWRVLSDDTGDMVLFAVHLPADASAKQLQSALELVSTAADEKEKELTDGADEY